MGFAREQESSSRWLVSVLSLAIFLSSCTIGRLYSGSEIRENPKAKLLIGSTTKADVLEIYGPPDGVQRQYDGDLFIYAYLRKNSSTLAIEDPLFSGLTFFTYTRLQQKKDRLVILFDKDGIVKNYGFYRETDELKPY